MAITAGPKTRRSGKGLLIVANFNQVVEISSVLERCRNHHPIEDTVVVDDGSTDGSDQVAREKGFHVIQHEENMGIGASIRTGIRWAQSNGYTWVLISSSNGKIKPEEYSLVSAPVASGEYDYSTGSRFVEGGKSPGLPLFRRITIPIFSLFASIILRKYYSDITCGFRAYTLKVVEDPSMNLDQKWLNRYEMEYYIHYKASRMSWTRIKEVPVTIEYDHLEGGRRSKIKPFVGWWSMIRPILFLAFKIRK